MAKAREGGIPHPFLLRRLHSLFGLWLAIYLFEHLLVNSQAAFFLKDDGYGFISLVNKIHSIPYLKIVEALFLAIPFLVHGGWGMYYAITGKMNARITDGRTPALPQYARNRAYSWQRITSWILVVGILAHVIQMRFVDSPSLVYQGQEKKYLVKLEDDGRLYPVAEKLGVSLFNPLDIQNAKQDVKEQNKKLESLQDSEESHYALKERAERHEKLVGAMAKKKIKNSEVIGVASSPGAAFFLVVRQTFTSPLMVILYSILVIVASYHSYNGLWTFSITWGITLTRTSQTVFRKICHGLIFIVSIMGLMAIWGTYIIIQLQPSG